MKPIVVVGAGLGGARAAENLRGGGYEGRLILVGKEAHPPYDRPPLSKSVLLGDQDSVALKPDDFWTEGDIELRTSAEVTSIDTAARILQVRSLADGSTEAIDYRAVVFATGLNPRTLPFAVSRKGVHVLRTVDDALALRTESNSAERVVVVGAGFIGCEVAASLRTRGLEVTLVEPAVAPLAAALGETVGNLVARIHAGRGVSVRTGVGVVDLRGDERVSAVILEDGTELPADLVVVGIGSTPAIDYLEGTGIKIAEAADGGGVACDNCGRTSVPDVYALGDVANWLDAQGEPTRVEHWNNVVDQAARVSAAILGAEPDNPRPVVPYFWSDQFDVKIQALGHPSPGDDVHVVDDDGTKFMAYYSRDGKLTGVVGAGRGGAVMKMRPKVLAQVPIVDVLG